MLVTKTTPFTLVILISIRKVAKADSRQVEPWLTYMRSTGYKLDMALREPMAHQRSREAYSSDGVTQRTVQVTAVTAVQAVTAVHTTVNRNKRNLKGGGKEGTAAAVACLEETHRTAHTMRMNRAVQSTYWCVTSFRRVNSYRYFAGLYLYSTRNVGNCLPAPQPV